MVKDSELLLVGFFCSLPLVKVQLFFTGLTHFLPVMA